MKTSKLRELIRESIKENFDDRLKSKMGMSDDEFEKNVTSRDIESPFPGTYSGSPHADGIQRASDLITQLKGDYKGMSDEELDSFSKEMVEHFLTNTTGQAAAKIFFGKRGL